MCHLKMKLLLTGIALLMLVENVFSLRCFECITTDLNCRDNPTDCSSGWGMFPPYCLKLKGEKDGKSVIVKQCFHSAGSRVEDSCESTELLGVRGTACSCTTDLCNNVDSISKNNKLFMLSLIFIVLLVQYM